MTDTLGLVLNTLAMTNPGAVYAALQGAIATNVEERVLYGDEDADISGRGLAHYGPKMRLGVMFPESIKVYHADYYDAPIVEGTYEGGATMIAIPTFPFAVARIPMGEGAAHRIVELEG